MKAAIEGSEEVWSAILASILTHIAVFVPLLFLSGVSSIMYRQHSVVVCFSLLMSLFGAVTLVPVLCSKLLKLPAPASERRGLIGRVCVQRADAERDGRAMRVFLQALSHRPTVVGLSAASVAVAAVIFRGCPRSSRRRPTKARSA
jgi:HAE1 family hydrophobic/amphiphilic exporter-1